MNPLPPLVWKALVELQQRCAEANWKLDSVAFDHNDPVVRGGWTFNTTVGPIQVYMHHVDPPTPGGG